ncbi:MAG: ribosome biogenesis GTPase YlqF [Bacillota bacterium]
MGQWFPGHMARAERELREHLAVIDIVIEVLDARAPLASHNPRIAALWQDKRHVTVLNKCDLADPGTTAEWLSFFQRQGQQAVATSGHAKQSHVLAVIRNLADPERARRLGRGVRVMVVGIPNVGKSTLLNALAGRKGARTGARPGVTKGRQWVRAGDLEILDLPGVLPAGRHDARREMVLAAIGAIAQDEFSPREVAVWLLGELLPKAQLALAARYQLQWEDMEVEAILARVGKIRGCLRTGGVIDTTAAAGIVLRDFSLGKLGRVSLEEPPPGNGMQKGN